MIAGERFDVIVIGAGVVGSSVAMGLAERGLKTLAVDIDLSGRLSSSEKNAGGVRATWWQRVNIALCRASIEYYQRVRDEVGFRQQGYLWLYDKDTFAGALEHIPLQRELGHPIEALTPAEVNRRVPEIDKLDGIAGATFSPADGLINPNLLKEHYRARALKLGAQFLDRTYVVAIDASASGVRLQCWQSDDPHTDDGLVRMMTQDGPGEAETGRVFELNCDSIVVAGGAWSPSAMKLLGLRNWTEPIRRQVCIVDNRETNLANYGMIVDTSGVYFHNEGPHILAGYSPPDEPPGLSLQLRRRAVLPERNLAANVRADVLDGASAPRHRMGWPVRSQSRPQRDRRPRRPSRLRGALLQRPRRDAILRRRPGPRRPNRSRQVQHLRRDRSVARPLRSQRTSLGGAPYLN